MININDLDPAERYQYMKRDLDYINDLQFRIQEALGPELAYNELCKALSTDERIENLEWIARCYDIPLRERK